MRAAEAAAFAAGTSEAELQARAGHAVAELAQRLCQNAPIVVVAGVGNNGRDGWVAARELALRTRVVRLYLAPRHAIAEDEVRALVAAGGTALLHTGADSLALLGRWLSDAGLVIDGLLGIGARGAPRPPLADITAAVNVARAQRRGALRVLAIDVPSGVDADSGAAEGECVRADGTVVLGALKTGLLRFPGAALAGALLPADIGLPSSALADQPVATLDRPVVRADVPVRPLDGHKGTFGRVLVAGGSPDYFGAPFLAGAAAARSGCGLLAFAAAPALQAVLAALLPEATYVVLPGGSPAQEPAEAAARTVAALRESEALLIGPGLGRTPGAREFIQRVLAGRHSDCPTVPAVVDADALYVLATEPAAWDSLGAGAVLTPHHGEMARLTGRAAGDIAADAWSVALAAAGRWGQVVVLKGPFTVVATPEGRAWVLPQANPALATGGTGDVLAGTIAGLLAQGLPPAAAARVAVYVHAAAARSVLERTGADVLLASNLPPQLSRELAALRAERGDTTPGAWPPWPAGP
jgi:NAD(P)H-hydrate epimerase